MTLKEIQEEILKAKRQGEDISLLNDEWHSFDDLYYHRMMLFAIICNTYKDKAWKSWKHYDGTMYDGSFIVGITTPEGNYTYHYQAEHWNNFKVKELANAPEWDGHGPSDITRLNSLLEEGE